MNEPTLVYTRNNLYLNVSASDGRIKETEFELNVSNLPEMRIKRFK